MQLETKYITTKAVQNQQELLVPVSFSKLDDFVYITTVSQRTQKYVSTIGEKSQFTIVTMQCHCHGVQ